MSAKDTKSDQYTWLSIVKEAKVIFF